jgi:2-hydroxychromene-2-carboxylate isomerase
MTDKFEEQGGAATMDPSPLRRWLTSTLISRLLKPQRLLKKRAKFVRQRSKSGAGHRVEFFYQLDDPYSHLAAQLLAPLLERYDIELVCFLVSGPSGSNNAQPELLAKYSRYDASRIAPHYGLLFPEWQSDEPVENLATAILAAQDSNGFINCVAQVGQAFWAGDKGALASLAAEHDSAPDAITALLETGNARRDKLGHYSGAMFYSAGEWYWGVDRLHYLETRLQELGAEYKPRETLLVPRPEIESGPLKDNGSLQLEIYVSLRSPYTAISFDRAVRLAAETGVELVVRPVLPMVMRGVPVTRQKGLYIFTDAAREALESDVDFGRFYDPVGEPVRRCYSLYPWACEQGKGTALLSSFLSCAFAEGVNTNTDKGLKKVVEKAGLDWQQAMSILGQSDWQAILEDNRQAMYKAGLWGVPSFRLLDKNSNEQILALWGQDRLWLIAREIQSRLASNNGESHGKRIHNL